MENERTSNDEESEIEVHKSYTHRSSSYIVVVYEGNMVFGIC